MKLFTRHFKNDSIMRDNDKLQMEMWPFRSDRKTEMWRFRTDRKTEMWRFRTDRKMEMWPFPSQWLDPI